MDKTIILGLIALLVVILLVGLIVAAWLAEEGDEDLNGPEKR